MKMRYYLFNSIVVLIAVFFAPATAMGQAMNSPANFTDEGVQQSVLKAKLSVPMDVRLGDVDLDGSITIGDVTQLIDMLLNGTTDSASQADVDLDGTITIGDVTELIDMLLNGSSDYDVSTAIDDLNEIYRSMRTAGWTTTGNTHQAFGISAYNLMAEVMGDDMIMATMGSGWFWFDACYNVKNRYTSTTWRSQDLWTAYYTWIGNANYILAASQSMKGTIGEVNYIKGQAYTIRAYSYFMLAQSFARTYKGHESDPCVPLFTAMVFNGSTGQPRSTVEQVYAQIVADIQQAEGLLNETVQQAPEHISYSVARGLHARIALVKEEWSEAYDAALDAIQSSGKTILEVSEFVGLNDATAGNVMWGADIPAEESGMYASFFAHMSVTIDAYGSWAPKQISNWLYSKMSETDARRSWWGTYNGCQNVQQKFDVVDGTEWEGDYIWMRVEEMYLIAAEAACRQNLPDKAKDYLNALMSKRDPSYSCTKTGTSLGALTNDETGSLLEEILIQRRLELWGEDGRIYTIRRLRQGFERTTDNGWPSQLLLTDRSLSDPESYPWVLTIPLTEFAGNANMNISIDQNPINDYASSENVATGPQNVTFEKESYRVETALPSARIVVPLKRSSTEGAYTVILKLTGDNMRCSSLVEFSDGSSTTSVTINVSDMVLGNSYDGTLSLSPADVANGDQEGRITSTQVEAICENVNPEGQHISFETALQELTYNEDDITSSKVTIPVTLTRAVATNSYTATLSMSDNSSNMTLDDQFVSFAQGITEVTFNVILNDFVGGNTYSCKISLSDADAATGDSSLGEQITSTTISVYIEPSQWISAGTCTFTDKTWSDGTVAENVPVQRKAGTNTYRIVSPLYYVYNGIESDPSQSHWLFTLNSDDTITPTSGEWTLDYWGYAGYYDDSRYPSYCYVSQEVDTYDVHFMLSNGSSLYSGGNFIFTWNR